MIEIHADDALLVVDIQNDFLPGGALGVPDGDRILPVLHRYMDIFQARGRPIVLTKDWHPADHCSFTAQGGTWPDHCIAGTKGADHPPGFRAPRSAVTVQKATEPDKEAYSAFQGTALDARLQQAGIHRLFVGGLATDYCVLNTVRDALGRGYAVCLLLDGIRAVNLQPEDGPRAVEEMIRKGAVAVTLEGVAA